MRTVNRLAVAQRAHSFTLDVYRATQGFPKEERFGLASQLRRAASSIGSNIAEGDSHNSNRQFARYLELAKGSTGEVAYQLLLASDLGYITPPDYDRLSTEIDEIAKMLVGLARRVAASTPTKTEGT